MESLDLARRHRQIGFDLDAGLGWASESLERSHALSFTCGQGFDSTADCILPTVAGDLDAAEARYSAFAST